MLLLDVEWQLDLQIVKEKKMHNANKLIDARHQGAAFSLDKKKGRGCAYDSDMETCKPSMGQLM